MKNQIRYEKKLLKLNNGYILEFRELKREPWENEPVVFAYFFNKFNNQYIVQKLRDYLIIRWDKDRGRTNPPWIMNIYDKDYPKDKLFKSCLKGIEDLVEKDPISEKDFNKKEIIVGKSVQDYFFEELHTHLSEPKFISYINSRKIKSAQ